MSFLPLISPFLSALTQGYSATQIIGHLLKKGGPIAKTIQKAMKQGYSEDKIAEYLTKGKSLSYGQREQMLSGMGERERATKTFYRGTDLSKVGKALGAGALAAGGAYAASKAIPAVGNFLKKTIGPQPMSGAPVQPKSPSQVYNAAQLPQLGAQGGAQPIQSPTQGQTPIQGMQSPNIQNQPYNPPVSSSIPQQAFPMASAENTLDSIEALGLTEQLDKIDKKGKNLQQISQELVNSMTPEQRAAIPGNGAPLIRMVRDYLSIKSGKKTLEPKPINPKSPLLTSHQKGDVVITPEGDVGEIESTRNKEALVKSGGKLHKVNATDLESLTHKYKDISFDVSTVPEKDRSAPLYGISSNRDNTALTVEFFPRNEAAPEAEYEYFRKDGKPFDEGILTRLKEGLDIPVTSGVEWAGFWNEEKGDSRGSANHKEMVMQAQDIDKVQSGEEPNDPSKPLFFKKKEKLFTHGFAKAAKKEFGKHSEAFRKELREIKRGKKERA